MKYLPKEFRKAVIKECDRKKVKRTDTTATNVLIDRLQNKMIEKHKKNGTRGPVPSVKINVIKRFLKKKGHGITGTLDTLEKRMKTKIEPNIKQSKQNKQNKQNVFYINKNTASANEAQQLMGLAVGDIVKFKNGSMKTLTECSSGGHRWKNA